MEISKKSDLFTRTINPLSFLEQTDFLYLKLQAKSFHPNFTNGHSKHIYVLKLKIEILTDLTKAWVNFSAKEFLKALALETYFSSVQNYCLQNDVISARLKLLPVGATLRLHVQKLVSAGITSR